MSGNGGKSLVLSAVNASGVGLELNAVVIEFAEIIGLSEEIVDKFNEMPLDQGRHQAIGGAMWFTKEAESFNDLTEVKDLFTYLVSKEYNKFLWINAVRDASSASEMETAVRTLVPILNETRQEIIASDPSNDLGLVGTNYTTTLFDINAMIETENNSEIARIAEELFTQAEKETFFGVVRIADVLRAIIDE